MSGTHTTVPYLHYDLEVDAVVDLLIPPINDPKVSKHCHVVIKMPDGGEMWLDIDPNDNCTDIRQFNSDEKMKGIGVFSIVNGRRLTFPEPAEDNKGIEVKGHGWNGGYVISLLTDKNDIECSRSDPNSDGNG